MSAANLADRYISDRHLPDKAIDLIDEAGSRMRINRSSNSPNSRRSTSGSVSCARTSPRRCRPSSSSGRRSCATRSGP